MTVNYVNKVLTRTLFQNWFKTTCPAK